MTVGTRPPRAGARSSRRGRWSTAEILTLRERYVEVGEPRLARLLGRTAASVRTRAARVFAALPRHTGPWQPEHWRELRLLLGAYPLAHVAVVLRRTLADVRARLWELRARVVTGPWLPADLALLKRLYGSRRDADLALILGRPARAVARKAAALCLRKDKVFLARRGGPTRATLPRWRAAELRLLRRSSPHHPNAWIARRLGRSTAAVVSRAHALGLAKSPTRLADMGRANVRLRWGRGRGGR